MKMEAQIRNRAHEIWELEGRPEGRAEHHWNQAISELSESTRPMAKSRATASQAAKTAGGAAKAAPQRKPKAKSAPLTAHG